MADQLPLLLHLSIWLPLILGVALLAGGSLPVAVVRVAGFAGFATPLVVSVLAWCGFDASLGADYQFGSNVATGLEALGISLRLGLNGISLPFYVLAGVVGFAAGLYAIQSKAERLHLYVALLLVMQAGLMGVFASIDVFFFYFFHELALIPTFILIAVWGGRDRERAAMKMTVYLTLGAMLSLAGLIALYVTSGAETFALDDLRSALLGQPLAESVQRNLFGLLMFGFGILVSLWPLHTWAPAGYGAAPTANAMLHAGVLKKFGMYGFLQVAVPLLPQGGEAWSGVLAWLALGNVVIVGLVAMAQRDLKQMLGYSSVMHMGYCFLGVACLSVVGAGGVVLLCVAHGLSVALLFLLATCIHHRAGTLEMDEIGGLATRAPVLGMFFATATLASIGLPGPGLANFWGELTVFMATYQAFGPLMTVLAVLGIVISAIYGLRALGKIFYGPETASFTESAQGRTITDMTWAEKWPALVLLVVLVGIGVWPKSLSDGANRALAEHYLAGKDVPAPGTVVELPPVDVPAVPTLSIAGR